MHQSKRKNKFLLDFLASVIRNEIAVSVGIRQMFVFLLIHFCRNFCKRNAGNLKKTVIRKRNKQEKINEQMHHKSVSNKSEKDFPFGRIQNIESRVRECAVQIRQVFVGLDSWLELHLFDKDERNLKKKLLANNQKRISDLAETLANYVSWFGREFSKKMGNGSLDDLFLRKILLER